jgi:hypothetical protein
LISSLVNKAGDTDFANIELANAGSLNAGTLSFSATCDDTTRPTIATTNASYIAGGYTSASPLTISLTGRHQALVKGTELVVSDGNNTDTVTVNTTVPAAVSGSSTVDVTGTSTNGMATAAAVRIAAVFGSGVLCNASTGVQFSIQETDNTWGAGTGKCVYPASAGVCGFTQTLGNAVTSSPNDLTTALWNGPGFATALDAGGARYFKVSVKMPTGLLNAAQNSQAKFNLTWHIDQA